MIGPYGLGRAVIPAFIVIIRSAAIRQRVGYLSGLANALLILSGGLLGVATASETPPIKRYPIEHTLRSASKRPLLLFAADGKPFAERGECTAEPVTLDELPRHFIDALIAMEDRRFYSHIGIDPRGILRAAKRNYEAGGVREGGSTITQQLVKISFLTSATTIERKLEEALLAIWLEFRLTKDQILERYLSSVYFGEGCFGVRAAARHYFDKPMGALTLSESALMVALIRSPTQMTKNLDGARQDAALVLRAMIRDGRLDKARLGDTQPAQLNAARADEHGAYYADWLAGLVPTETVDPRSLQPLRVHTTFEPVLQRIAETAVRSVLDKEGGKRNASQVGLVAMRTDGRVVAMIGGREWAASQFNRAVQARRQPGSAFKTFVYLAALRAGAPLDMMMVDEPISIDGWEPKNFDDRHRGNVTLTEAFSSSINTVAVMMSEAVGREAVMGTARDLGISSPMAPNASLSLGTSEVSLLEMTAAYAAIAAGAYPVKPWGVAGLGAKPAGGGEPPLDAGLWKLIEAESMRDLLSSVVESGSGLTARLPIPAFGKTGTSQGHRDAWFIGFAGNLVVGVWVGNDNDTPMKRVTGGSFPAQIWQLFMRGALKTDTNFQRKLPRIAAFAARTPAPVDRAASLASLEGLLSGANLGSGRGRHIPTSGFFRHLGPAAGPTVRRAPSSRDFQSQLNELGWPGR